MAKMQVPLMLLAGAAGLVPLPGAPAFAQAAVPGDAVDVASAGRQPALSSSDIIVTAQRRAERAQDVPIVITAFTPKRIEQQGISRPQDLQASVPSLVVGSQGQTRETESYSLRGQGATFQGAPGVVVYLNEVPLPAPLTLSQQGGPGNFVDLENLQVLAGPQGTLFGRNTTGGAVLLVPKKPTNNFSGWIQGKYGNYNGKELEGAINIPVVEDKLLVRVVGAYHDRDGFTKDVVWNKRRDDLHWYSGRIGITFRPTERIENYLMAYGAYSRNNGTGYIHNQFNIPALSEFGICSDTPISVTGDYSCDVYRAASLQAAALGPRKTAHGVDDFYRLKTWGLTDTLNIDLSDNLILRNIFSYQSFKSEYSYDGDATVIQQYDNDNYKYPNAGVVVLPGTGTPITYNNASPYKVPRDHYSQITEELQIQGTFFDKHLTFTAGGFYYHQKPEGFQAGSAVNYCPAVSTGQPSGAVITNGALDTTVPGGGQPSCVPNLTGGYVDTVSHALYAQGTFDFGAITPALRDLRLTGGFRYTWDRLKGFERSLTPTLDTALPYLCAFDSSLSATADGCDVRATLRSKAPTWTIGLDYKPVRNLLLYGKVTRGYKAGMFNPYAVRASALTVKPEAITTYEAGFKTDLRVADMPARINATYYYTDYKNIQRASGDFNTTTNTGGAAFYSASAHIQGIELEASIRPSRSIEIGSNFSYTDFKYTRFNIPNNGIADCNGLTRPVSGAGAYTGLIDIKCTKGAYVSPYIWSIHAAWDIPLGDNDGSLSMFVNYSLTSPQHTSTGVQGFAEYKEKLPAFGVLSASLDWRNIRNSGFDIGFFVTNATNKLYEISGLGVWTTQFVASPTMGEPRMYGMKLRYHFGGE